MRCLAAGVVLLLAAVTGCSAGEAAPAEVAPLASGSASPSGDEPSVPPTTAVATATVSPAAVPTAATRETPQGASAFTEYYFAILVNEAYASGDATKVASLSDAACGSCANIVADIERLAKAGLTVSGRRFIVHFAEAAPPGDDASVIVDFRFSSDPYEEREAATGEEVRSEPAQNNQDAQVKLVRRGRSWTVAAIRTV